jgi:hypothetical protein
LSFPGFHREFTGVWAPNGHPRNLTRDQKVQAASEKVDGELYRSRFGAEEPCRTQVSEQPSHGAVFGQHERGELGDPLIPGPVG